MSGDCCDGFGGAGGASPGGGGIDGINVEDEGAPVAGGPFTTLNFTGGGVAATNGGGGTADIAIPGITFRDEGVAVAGAPHTIADFSGNGVAVTNGGGGVATITVPGITFQDEGGAVAGAPHTIANFVGGGVTVTNGGGGVATITVPSPPSAVQNPFSPPEQWFGTVGSLADEDLGAAVSPFFDTIAMMRDGSIVGLRTRLVQTLTGLDDMIVEVYKNGVATGLFVQHNSGVNPTGGVTTAAVGAFTYSSGDLIGLHVTTGLDFDPATVDVTGWIECYEAL